MRCWMNATFSFIHSSMDKIFHKWHILFLLAGSKNTFPFLMKRSMTISGEVTLYLNLQHIASLMTFLQTLLGNCRDERKECKTEECDLPKHLSFKGNFDSHDNSVVTWPFWRRNFPAEQWKAIPVFTSWDLWLPLTSFKMSIKFLMNLVKVNLQQTIISLPCQLWEC